MHKKSMIFSAALLAGAVSLAGCNNNKKTDTVAAAPPSSEPLPTPMVSEPPPVPPSEPVPEAGSTVPVGPDMVAAPPPHGKHSKHAKAEKGGKLPGGIYIVKSGDTLYGIARKHYHSAKMISAIIKANPGIDPNHIKVGQKIKLP